MKLNKKFVTHETEDGMVMVSTSSDLFSGVVRLNETASFIVNCLKEETTFDGIISTMLEVYNASQEQITSDVETTLNSLRTIGALDEK